MGTLYRVEREDIKRVSIYHRLGRIPLYRIWYESYLV